MIDGMRPMREGFLRMPARSPGWPLSIAARFFLHEGEGVGSRDLAIKTMPTLDTGQTSTNLGWQPVLKCDNVAKLWRMNKWETQILFYPVHISQVVQVRQVPLLGLGETQTLTQSL